MKIDPTDLRRATRVLLLALASFVLQGVPNRMAAQEGPLDPPDPVECPYSGCNLGNCFVPKIIITGTSLGKDNVHITSDILQPGKALEIYWTVYSGCGGNSSGNCTLSAITSAHFSLDGDAGLRTINPGEPQEQYAWGVQTDSGGISGEARVAELEKPDLALHHHCKHTLTIKANVRSPTPQGGLCAFQATLPVESNPITLWINESQAECETAPPGCKEPLKAAPVDIASGKMFHEMVDLRIDGPLPIEFVRRYDSNATYTGALGYGWQHNGMVRLEWPYWVPNMQSRVLVNEEMRRITFNCRRGVETSVDHITCAGVWRDDDVDHLKLTEGGDAPWTVEDKYGKKYRFDGTGKLTKIEDRNGNTITYQYDPSTHDLVSISDTYGRAMTLIYVPGTHRLESVSAGSRTVTYHYSDTDPRDLIEVTYSDGSGVAYDYADHKMISAVDSEGHLIEGHHYDEAGRVDETQSEGGNYFYSFNRDDPMYPTVTDGRNPPITTTYTIDTGTGVATDRSGGPGCASCGDAGNETHKLYDEYLNVTDITDGRGTRTHMTYDPSGNMLTRTEAYTTADCTGEPGAPSCASEACDAITCAPLLARKVTLTYNDLNLPTSVTEPTIATGTCAAAHPDKVTKLEYELGNLHLVKVEGCDGSEFKSSVTTFNYDTPQNHNRLLSVDGPRSISDVTTYAYYSNSAGTTERGRLHTVTTSPLPNPTTYNSYDVSGNVLSVTDPNGVETTYEYDFRNHVTRSQIKVGDVKDETDDIVTIFDYDSVGNLRHVSLPNCAAPDSGCAFSYGFEYDGVNRLTEVHDALGNKVKYFYDAEGNLTAERFHRASGAMTKFTNFNYDDFNRLVSARFDKPVKPPHITIPIAYSYQFFEDGTYQDVRDPLSHFTTFTYDDLKRVRSVTQRVGSEDLTTRFEYDSQDNLTRVTDPRGLDTTYTYSDLGWRRSTSSPDTGTTNYVHDLSGNLVETTDANGIVVSREYDELNRLTSISYPDSSLDVTVSYDSANVTFGIGRRTGMIDPSGESIYEYDPRGLLVREIKLMRRLGVETGYTYDKSGNLKGVDYPTSPLTQRSAHAEYDYDDANRVTAITTNIEDEPATVVENVQYMPFGPPSGMTFGNTLVDARTYDTRYRLGDWTLGNLLDYTHHFDDDSNLLTVTDQLYSPNNRSFAYDEIHRLTSAAGPWGAGTGCSGKTYEYDDNGNRTCKGESGDPTSYVYPPESNRLSSSTIWLETTSYDYDDNGSTTADLVHEYLYNDSHRLASVEGGLEVPAYTYDGDGRRVIKSFAGVTTYYFYDPAGRLLTEMIPDAQFGGPYGKDYLYLNEAPIARVDWSTTPMLGDCHGSLGDCETAIMASKALFFYHTDHLGTPIAMTDGSAGLVWKAEMNPFGDVLSLPFAAIENNLRFPGQYFDIETGLHQNGFRDYDPKTGRYREADPIGLAGGLNPYSYASNSPANFIDPAGLDDQSWFIKWVRGFFNPDPPPNPAQASLDNALEDAAGNSVYRRGRIDGVHPGAVAGPAAKDGVATTLGTCSEQLALQFGAPAVIGLVGRGLLAGSEAAGGHLLARHVGKSTAELAARLAGDARLSAASTFGSTAEAEAALQAALRAGESRISAWVASGANGRLPLDTAFSGGSVLLRGASSPTAGNGVRVVLQGNGSGGWYVFTGYPTP